MNHMKELKTNLHSLSKLADLIGDFIRYWGFRKIHGEIWTVVYLSKSPVSATELIKILKVSKALMSPALRELEDEGLIFQTDSENSKTKRYAAVDDVYKVIKSVLDRREKPLIEKIVAAQGRLGDELSHPDSASAQTLNKLRYQNLKRMTEVAQMSLAMIATIEMGYELDLVERD